MARYGVSSWSLHRTLAADPQAVTELPEQLRVHGLTDLQICHFHLAQTDDASLKSLRERIDRAGIRLDALLIDFGDLANPQTGAADADAIEPWLEVAAKLGATHARVSAGSQAPNETTLAQSARLLLRLADRGDALGVKLITENWHALLPGSREVLRLIELTNGRVPLCLDFGNWSGPGKYAELAAIAPHAVTAHAKCAFNDEGKPDADDFTRCCDVLRDAGFAGTLALIYDSGPADEWRFLDIERSLGRGVWHGGGESIQDG